MIIRERRGEIRLITSYGLSRRLAAHLSPPPPGNQFLKHLMTSLRKLSKKTKGMPADEQPSSSN